MKHLKLTFFLLLCVMQQLAQAELYYFSSGSNKFYCKIENDQLKTVAIIRTAPAHYAFITVRDGLDLKPELKDNVISLPSQVQLRRNDGKNDSSIGAYTLIGLQKNAFAGCTMLHEITLPPSVTSIGEGAFSGCTNLKNVKISREIKHVEVNAFDGCDKLEKVNVMGNDTDNVSNYSSFYGILCKNGKIVFVPNMLNRSVLEIPTWVSGIAPNAFANRKYLNSIKMLGVKTIEDGAFKNCEYLKQVVLGNSLTTIGEGAFEECAELETINLPSSLQAIKNRAFYNCLSIASVSLGMSLTEIGTSAFENCAAIKAIALPQNLKYIGQDAFKNCYELESVTFSSPTNGLRTLSSGAFSFCSKLRELRLPTGLKYIETNAFLGCTALVRVMVNNDLESINRYAFMGCSNLTTINIPEQTKTYDETFIDCPRLNR